MTQQHETLVRLVRTGRVTRVQLSRAAKRNALSTELIGDATAALQALSADSACLVIVLSGDGGVFSAGADVREMQSLDAAGARRFITGLHTLIDTVRRVPQIVLASIAGHCYGGALELAAACDLRIAAEGTQFGMPEVRVGMPSVIEAALLVPLIGLGRAADLVLTGENIDTSEAQRIGLVSRVVPAAALAGETDSLAQRLAGYSGPALRLQKRLLRSWLEAPSLAEAVQRGIDTFEEAFASPNPREAITAFLERRQPRFPES